MHGVGGVVKWSLRTVEPGAAILFGGLILANAAAWAWAYVLFSDRPALMATALLAWVFGLRHAVDADHIAAIDNVTRKLMQEGKRPIAVGFFPARSFEHRHCRFSAHSRDSEQPATAFSRLDRAGGSDRDVCFGAVFVCDRDNQHCRAHRRLPALPASEGRPSLCR